MLGRLQNKRVLVTAAGQGIGRACAELFLNEGAALFATDVDPRGLDALAARGARVGAVDGADETAVSAYFAESPPLDAVVHCVGIVQHGSVLECDQAAWERSFKVNVDSYYYLLRNVLPGMLESGGGSVVCIASVASSLKGLPHRAAYGSTKAAMIGLTKSVAADYIHGGVRANAVCPGTIETKSLLQRVEDLGRDVGGYERAMAMFTERQPVGRLGRAEEVAALCLYLASDESRFTTGQVLAVDGGMTI